MKNKILELALECYEILGFETSPKQAKKIEKEISVYVDAYESEMNEILESRARARESRAEAIKLAACEYMGSGFLPFLARQKAEQSEKLEYARAKKFSPCAQKCEFLMRFWQDAKNAGGVLSLLQNDKDGKYDVTIKSLVALYNATIED